MTSERKVRPLESARKARLLEKLAGRQKSVDVGLVSDYARSNRQVQRLKMRIAEDSRDLNDRFHSRVGRRATKRRHSANQKMLKSIPNRYHHPKWSFTNRIHRAKSRNVGPVGADLTKIRRPTPGQQAAELATKGRAKPAPVRPTRPQPRPGVPLVKTKLPTPTPGQQKAELAAKNRGTQGPFTRMSKQFSRIPHVAAYVAAGGTPPSFSPKKLQLEVAGR